MAFSQEKLISIIFLLTILLISLMFSTYQDGIVKKQDLNLVKNKKPKKVQFTL